MNPREDRPHLVAVDPSAPAPAPAPPAGEARGWRWLPWLLAAALVVAALGWTRSAREGARLAAELEGTRQALGVAEGRLEAHERHLGVIRDRVDTLVRDLGDLDALVERDPAPAASAPAP